MAKEENSRGEIEEEIRKKLRQIAEQEVEQEAEGEEQRVGEEPEPEEPALEEFGFRGIESESEEPGFVPEPASGEIEAPVLQSSIPFEQEQLGTLEQEIERAPAALQETEETREGADYILNMPKYEGRDYSSVDYEETPEQTMTLRKLRQKERDVMPALPLHEARREIQEFEEPEEVNLGAWRRELEETPVQRRDYELEMKEAKPRKRRGFERQEERF